MIIDRLITSMLSWAFSGGTNVTDATCDVDVNSQVFLRERLYIDIQSQWLRNINELSITRQNSQLSTCKNCGYESHAARCPKCRGWKR